MPTSSWACPRPVHAHEDLGMPPHGWPTTDAGTGSALRACGAACRRADCLRRNTPQRSAGASHVPPPSRLSPPLRRVRHAGPRRARRERLVHAQGRRDLRPEIRHRADDGRLHPQGERQRQGRGPGRQRRLVLGARGDQPRVREAAAGPGLHRVRGRPRQPAEIHHPRGRAGHEPRGPFHPPPREGLRDRPRPTSA